MNSSGVAVKYGDVAPEAKENFIPSASEKEDFVNLEQLGQYNLNFKNYANPCELYQTVLDGASLVFPFVPENENMGLWSEQLSNEDGEFENPVVLTLTADGQYSSQGITLTFDTYNDIYCNYLNIQWYRDEELLCGLDFIPDSASYFCRQLVENYDKLIITFYSLNMPKNRLKLRVIDYGYGTFFYGDELRSVKLIQEIDPISSEIAINTCDFTLDSKTDMEYSFQTKQPISVYFNGELKATTFVKTSKRTAKRLWQVQSEDYVGLLDSIPFCGGIYTNSSAVSLLEEIFTAAKVPYNIDGELAEKTVTGYIPYTTCREALMQVAFAVGAVVDTSNSENVDVYKLDDEIKQTIPLERIMQGQSFTDGETVTGVEVTAHTYITSEEMIEVYKGSESGAGENILVKFSEPLHDLIIADGEIIESGANYAVINAGTICNLAGAKYEHTTVTKRLNNPTVLASEIEKIATVDNATLVSSLNIDDVLANCYSWLTRVNETNLKIVEGKHITGGEILKYGQAKYGERKYGDTAGKIVEYDQPVNVGEVITSETEYLGSVAGRVIKQSFNLNGGIIVKEVVLK